MSKRALRKAYGEHLVELGKKYHNIVVLDADLSSSTQTIMFQKEFPSRHFNAGIAESNMVLMAAGLAKQGKIAFASSFAMFLTGRAWEMIRNTVAYDKLNVKLVATHAGVSVGEDGSSHQANEDIGLIRLIPHMSIYSPADYHETKLILAYIVEQKGPTYVRLSREVVPDLFKDDVTLTLKPNHLLSIKGETSFKLAIFTTGIISSYTYQALSQLKDYCPIHIDHYHILTLKPFDDGFIKSIIGQYDVSFTIEEHSIIGGLGDAILSATALVKKGPIYKYGMKDEYGQSGKSFELLQFYHLDEEGIIKTIKENELTKPFFLK